MLSLLHSNVTSQRLHHAPHLIPSHTHYKISLTRRVSTVQKDILRETAHVHITFIAVLVAQSCLTLL